MLRSLVAVLCLAAAPSALRGAGEFADEPLVAALQPFAFLLGEWDAVPGQSGETGGFTFKAAAQGRVIVRTNFASYPASAGKPASRHDDFMVIAVERGAVHADYYDSEDHIIRYVGRSPAAGQVEFVSEVRSGEPRYRLRYTANADGSVAGQFDVAPPGKPDDFARYLTWSARRRQ